MRIYSLIVFLALFSGSQGAEVYKWVDDDGKVHFSDKKPESSGAEKIIIKTNTYSKVTYYGSIYDVGNNVVMYSAEWCGYCKKARKYFIENNISFIEYDIEKDSSAKQRHKAMGAKGIPVILKGKKRMNGFSIKGFEQFNDEDA